MKLLTLLFLFTMAFSAQALDYQTYSCHYAGSICYEYTENENTEPQMPAHLEDACEGEFQLNSCQDKVLGCLLTGHGNSFPFDVSVWYYDFNYNDALQSCRLSGGEFVENRP